MNNPDEILSLLIIFCYLMIGACMGSFASAISYRVRHGLSWISRLDDSTGRVEPARSTCVSCGHQLSFLDLIPLFSWICAAGKCRYCHATISIGYPIIEVAGALAVLCYGWESNCGAVAMVIYIALLPFSLSFFLLICHHFKPPYYIFSALLLNIFILVYSNYS